MQSNGTVNLIGQSVTVYYQTLNKSSVAVVEVAGRRFRKCEVIYADGYP